MRKNFRLDELPKRNPYQVPAHYFDRLPARVMALTTGAEAQQPAWHVRFWALFRPALAPLLLLLVFVSVYFLNVSGSPAVTTTALSEVAKTEIMDYLTRNDSRLETADVVELSSLPTQHVTADFMNISNTAAEEELEYYTLTEEDF